MPTPLNTILGPLNIFGTLNSYSGTKRGLTVPKILTVPTFPFKHLALLIGAVQVWLRGWVKGLSKGIPKAYQKHIKKGWPKHGRNMADSCEISGVWGAAEGQDIVQQEDETEPLDVPWDGPPDDDEGDDS